MNPTPRLFGLLDQLRGNGLMVDTEVSAVRRLLAADSPLAGVVGMAETLHLHIKVDDTLQLPLNALFDAGARLDHQQAGYVKFRFAEGLNLIFSHIKVSQDELRETAASRRSRPFLDHMGVDLRNEQAPVRAAFDALPATAAALGWAHASQGGTGQPVFCCHVQVAEKHWLYPGSEDGTAGIPLEFAFGALTVTPGQSGCDLRPSDPRNLAAPGDVAPANCGTANTTVDTAQQTDYYQAGDLARFGEIARVNPALGQAFFGYYQQVMAEGALGKREKALAALAIAHALKCPYNIRAWTETLHEHGVDEAQMNEAVHVASAITAGIAMVHSLQMINRLDELRGDATKPGCC